MVITEKEILNIGKEILIVDDEPGYRAVINKKLKSAGYHTFQAQNGEEALVALWEKQNISLVLLDVRLPHMNGLNIFEIIQKDFPGKRIIICSSLKKEEQQFLINNVDDYYCKDEDLNCLVEKISNILSNKSKVGVLGESDKRSFRRIPVNVLASCESINHLIPSSCAHFFTYTKDLSLQGGRFVVAEDVKVGQHFSVALELPANFFPVLIDCEVVWVKGSEGADLKSKRNNEVGVRFLKLDLPQDEEKLKNYLSLI